MLGRAVLAHMKQHGNHRHRIVIGKDTWLSDMIEMSPASGGWASMRLSCAAAHLTQDMRVISCCHNPYEETTALCS